MRINKYGLMVVRQAALHDDQVAPGLNPALAPLIMPATPPCRVAIGLIQLAAVVVVA